MATGVVTLDGSSEVKMVALEGDMRYLVFKVPIKASLKPAQVLVERKLKVGAPFLSLCYRCLR